MKKILFTLATALMFASCNTTQKEVVLTYPTGEKELVYETQMVNGEKQRIAEEMFYKSGKTRYYRGYKDNKPSGLWKYYYESGKLFAEADFSNSTVGTNWVFYYEDGTTIFDEKDEITILEITRDRVPLTVEGGDDIAMKQCQFYTNFGLRSEGVLKNNKREGRWVFYFENGNKQAEGNFVNDVQNGDHVVYHENGALYYQGVYENGKRVGEWLFFDEHGRKIASKSFDEK